MHGGSPASMRLPRAFRLPNAPHPFVGREAALVQMREVLDSASALVVSGPAGVGKSALALRYLHAVHGAEAGSGLLARIGVDLAPPEQLEAQLRRLLAMGPATAPDWRVLDADPEEALAALIDLADAGQWTLLLDNADLPETRTLVRIVSAASRWARRSRWILTTRDVPASFPAELPVLALPPLDRTEISAIAAGRGRSPTAHGESAGPAGTGGRPGDGVAPGDSGLEDEVHRTRRTLALLHRPIPPDALRALDLDPDGAAMQHLEAEGALRRFPDGSRLLKTDRRAAPPLDEATLALAGRCAERLETLPDPLARLEALRLWLHRGDGARALAWLDAHGPQLCELDLGSDLSAVLHAHASARTLEPELKDWRAWAAWEAGDRSRTDAGLPEPDSWIRAWLRTRVALNRGDLPEAIAAGRAAMAVARTDRQHDRAALKAARAALSAGQLDEVDALIACCRSHEDEAIVEVELLRAECEALRGHPDAAGTRAEALVERVELLLPSLRLRAFLGIVRIHLLRQRLRDAEAVIDALLRLRSERATESVAGRTALEMGCAVAIQRGNFARLRQLAGWLEQVPDVPRVRAIFVDAYRVTADLWQEPASGAGARIDALGRAAQAEGAGMAQDVLAYVDVLHVQAAVAEGRPPNAVVLEPDGETPPTASLATSRELVRAWHRARWGETVDVPEPGDLAYVEHRLLAALARGTALLVTAGGDAATAPPRHPGPVVQARGVLAAALAEAQTAGYALQEVALHRHLALAGVLGDDPTLTAASAAALSEWADAMASPRLREEATLLACVGEDQPPDPAWLERMAGSSDAIATVRRWSRWLLGGAPALDPLEQRVLERLAEHDGWARIRTLGEQGTSWRSGYGLDAAHGHVWGSLGQRLDLSRHATLRRVLEVLLAAGGTAGKEDLLRQVWAVENYHPLHHDNRLRVAVRKLRQRFHDAGMDDPLDTLEDGYALRGTWRLR